MTEYEMASLYNTLSDSVVTRFAFFMALTFAMFILSFVMAPKLRAMMAGVVVGVFTLFSLLTLLSIYLPLLRLADIQREIERITGLEPAWVSIPVVPPSAQVTTLLIAVYVAAVWFFVQAWRERLTV